MRPIVLMVLLVLATACRDAGPTSQTWGDEAVSYFETWTGAYTENDTYAVLDFYTPDATIEDRTGVFRDARPSVRTVLRGNTATLTRELIDVFVGADDALVLVLWPDYETEYGMVHARMARPYIGSETISQDVESLTSSLRVSPEVVARYEAVRAAVAAAWSGGGLSGAYAPDATSVDALTGDVGVVADGERWIPASLRQDGQAGLFLDPPVYGADPDRAIGVFEVTTVAGCSYRMAVRWEMSGTAIQRESRYPEVESYRACRPDGVVDGWWTDLMPPGPRDEVETGVVSNADGAAISIRNGTPQLEKLVRWGLRRYRQSGLGEPRVDTITFEPTRDCQGVAGRVIAAGEAKDLVLCIDASDLCNGASSCAAFALGPRVGMLHELAHAWMIDRLDDATRRDLLQLSGRTAWVDDTVPWGDRGVEYAAQVMAWGLADEPISLVELGRPPCDEITSAFRLLTGRQPLSECPAG